jgi:hypothetical protein
VPSNRKKEEMSLLSLIGPSMKGKSSNSISIPFTTFANVLSNRKKEEMSLLSLIGPSMKGKSSNSISVPFTPCANVPSNKKRKEISLLSLNGPSMLGKRDYEDEFVVTNGLLDSGLLLPYPEANVLTSVPQEGEIVFDNTYLSESVQTNISYSLNLIGPSMTGEDMIKESSITNGLLGSELLPIFSDANEQTTRSQKGPSPTGKNMIGGSSVTNGLLGSELLPTLSGANEHASVLINGSQVEPLTIRKNMMRGSSVANMSLDPEVLPISSIAKSHRVRPAASEYFQDMSITETLKLALCLYPGTTADQQSQMVETVRAAFEQMGNVFTTRDAAEWGAGFKVPLEDVTRDVALFEKCSHDLNVMVDSMKNTLIHDRLSVERVLKHVHLNNPDRARIMALAEFGMPALHDPNFIPNGGGPLPPLRNLYKSVAPTVNKLMSCFVVLSHVDGSHESPLSWTDKEGKKQGRPLNDCSDGGKEPGNMPLNSEFTKKASNDMWGVIVHPTLADICRMTLRYFKMAKEKYPDVSWEDIVLWKMDLRGAYTLLFMRTEDVRLFSSLMTDDQVIFFFCGIFGWTGTPAAFQVVTRVVMYELALVLEGLTVMYVDDVIGVCLRRHVEREMAITNTVLTNLLGSDSVEPKAVSSSLQRLMKD